MPVKACTFFLVMLLSIGYCFAQTDSLSRDTVPKAAAPAPEKLSARDSLKKNYVNPGKVAGRRALFKSLILPGLGQLDNFNKYSGQGSNFNRAYSLGKIAVIYTGATLLTLSYIENNRNYKAVLSELQYRQLHGGALPPDGAYNRFTTTGLTNAKDTYKRNKQIIIFSYGAIYLASAIDAYVSARLRYFNVDDNLSFKLQPGVVSTHPMLGYQAIPALKLTFPL